MATATDLRHMALALAGTEERPHFDRAAFRAARIYVTLAADGRTANFMFAPDEQALKCLVAADAFSPLPNAWGRQAKPCSGPAQVMLKEIINEARPPGLSLPPTPTLVVAVPDGAVFARDKAYRFEIVAESERTGGANARMLRFQFADEAPWPNP